MVPVSDDVLMHWKYIKRVKKNGKWKYYYDWDQLKKDTSNKIQTTLDKAADKLGVDERDRLKEASRKQTEATLRNIVAKSNFENLDTTNRTPDEIRKSGEQYRDSSKEKAKAEKNYQNAVQDYVNTPIGKLEAKHKVTVSKGVDFIKSISKKVDDIKDKAGVDEKERLKNAAATRATSESEREVNLQKYVTSYDEYHNAEHPQLKQKAKRRLDVDENSYESSRNKVSTARSEYEQALNEYINTPIGKIEGSIYFMQGQKYYERLLKSRRKIINSDGSVKYLHEKD